MKLEGIILLGLFLAGFCNGIFENCDFYEELVPRKSYFVASPNYPDKYPPGTSCRWYAVSPQNTRIFMTCEKFYIPLSRDCKLDRLSISRNGRIDLVDIENHCGNKEIQIISNGNTLNLVLLTEFFSPGGSFFCHLGVKENQPPPRPPPQPSCLCGYTNTMRVVGGTETGVNEYPMMAALVDRIERDLFCGATIISQKFSLTAAHCFSAFPRKPQDVGLLVGDHAISVGNDTDSAKIYMIERFILHPDYNDNTQRNDIALVAVRRKIQFSRKVGPVCLPFLNVKNSFAGETVYALGWGATDFVGPDSDKLLQAPLDVVTLQQCKSSYGDLVWEKQICTYKEGKDACQKDSGGPLLWRDPHSKVVKILGIISYGVQCATTNPSVNTRVTSYLDWIKDTTGEDYCII